MHPARHRRPATAGADHDDAVHRPQRVLGSGLLRPQRGSGAPVAGPRRQAGRGQSGARRDRHTGADRHRPVAGRSRDAAADADGGRSVAADRRAHAQAADRVRHRRSAVARHHQPGRSARRSTPRRSTWKAPFAMRSPNAATSRRRGRRSRPTTSICKLLVNQTMPALDFTANYQTAGIGGTRFDPRHDSRRAGRAARSPAATSTPSSFSRRTSIRTGRSR